MDYIKYDVSCLPEQTEWLIALLAEAPFDTFEETATGFSAYLPETDQNEEEAEALLVQLLENFSFQWQKNRIPGQNWNEIWESNFQPVIVEDFCAVRADFHDPIPGVRYELVINPKMAFGTGHHETTWMCMSALESLPVQGAALLDYGCGTGVLAILAAKLGAKSIEAVDIESESYLNTLENSQVNQTPQVIARHGDITAVQNGPFDGILANINRHIILDSLPQLATLTRPGGWLLVSGILLQDESIVTDAAQRNGFVLQQVNSRGNWLCMRFVNT